MMLFRTTSTFLSQSIRPLSCARLLSCTVLSRKEEDIVVIGGGPGGYVAAIKAGQLGLSVTCVEGRGALGGTCLNVGCIPGKALLHASHLYHEAQHDFAKRGIIIDGTIRVDLGKMMAEKDSSVRGLTSGIEGLFKKYKVKYAKGWGKITGPNSVQVTDASGNTSVIQAKHIVIATGSEVSPLPGIPIDEVDIISSTGALSLPKVPKSMVVIGGGVIGLELGSVWSRLGADVTVVEFMPAIAAGADGKMAGALQRALQNQGLKFKLSTKVAAASKNPGGGVDLTLQPAAGGETTTLNVEKVLVSVGRRPFTEGLGLA